MAYIAKLTNEGGVKSLNRYVSMLAGNAAFVDTAYESIATTTVGAGGTSSITFSSIPSTYKHLQIRYLVRTSASYQFDFTNAWFNNTRTANTYVTHMLDGTGAAAQGESFGASTAFYGAGLAAGNTNGSNVFAVGVMDILDYTNTNKNTTIRTLSGFNNNDTNNGRQIALSSGVWLNTSAVDRIDFDGNGSTIQQYSSFALYGVK